MKKTIGALMVAVSAVALSNTASALEYNPYVGLDYSYSIANTENSGGLKPQYNAAAVSVGTTFNKYFGTEVFYQMSDTSKKNDKTGTLDWVKSSFEAYGLDMVGTLPLGCDQKWALLGTAGLGEYTLTAKANGVKADDDHGLGYRWGLGAQYDIDAKWAVRGLVRYVNFDGLEDVDHMVEYVAGVRYSF